MICVRKYPLIGMVLIGLIVLNTIGAMAAVTTKCTTHTTNYYSSQISNLINIGQAKQSFSFTQRVIIHK